MNVAGRKTRIKEFFDDLARKGGGHLSRKTAYYRYITKLVGRLIPARGRILELGSGPGQLLASLEPEHGVGLDISDEMVRLSSESYPDYDFRAGDAEALSPDEQFDVVLGVNLVGVLDDVYTCFKAVRKTLPDSGRFVIVYHNQLWEPLLKLAAKLGLRSPVPNENWLPLSDLANILRLADFDVVRTGRRMLCPVGIPVLSWFLNTIVSPLPGFQWLGLVEYVVARPAPSKFQAEDGGPSCSVIIPTRDEKGNIEDAITRTAPMGRHTEYIFIDGNSSDGTVEEIHRVMKAYPDLDIKFASQDGKGKADAVRKGFAMASEDILMILDSDLTMPPEDLPKYYEALVTGKAEFVNGCRLVYPMEDEAMRFLNKIANHAFGKIFSWLMEQTVRDTLCGTKVLRREAYDQIAANRTFFGDFDPFGDFDLLFGAARLNL
ncbi:MAG: glycosyltransferase, partial [Kiritimatiellia bacterium]|nr:glycosyltransferase [Kiritimatiellia bacterium]